MGTPAFAVAALGEVMASGHDVAAVYTQPARKRGRGHKEQPSPVGSAAEAYGLNVRTPTTLKTAEAVEGLSALEPDVALVVAYGQILPQAILDIPRHGCLNLHASLLPRWRGAAPIQRAIMAGDQVTGVQVMRMEAGLDTGPILLSEHVPIPDDATYQTLHDNLMVVGAGLLPRALAALQRGGLTQTPQATEGVTYARKITAEDARVVWEEPSCVVDRQIRGLSPFPGAYAELDSVRIKFLMSRIGPEATAAPGTLIDVGDSGLTIACGDGRSVIVTRLQRAGKAAQDVATFLRGMSLDPGTVFS